MKKSVSRKSKQKRKNARSEELRLLRHQLTQTQGAIDSAQAGFDQAKDPVLVDCFIYEWNAAQLRYQFLLKCIKDYEDTERESPQVFS